MGTLTRVPGVLLLLLALVAGCTPGVSGSGPQVVEVGSAGGVVGASGGLARVAVPPDAVPDGSSIRIAPAAAPPPSTSAVVTALRAPVEITPSAPIENAEVRLPFDPATDLPEADGRRATVANSYIAVFSPAVGAWVPLESRFDDGELVARAPHFSVFGTFVVDPAKAGWSATKTGVQAAWDTGGDLLGAAWDTGGDLLSSAGAATTEFLNPPKAEIDEFCEPATDGWDLDTPVDQIDGCVRTAANGDLLVWVENGLRLMYDARPPRGTDIGLNEHDGFTALVPYIARRMNLQVGLALVPARGLVRMRIPAQAARRLGPAGSSFTVRMEPEQLGLAVQAVFAALAWLPGRKYVEQTVVRLEQRGAFTALTERGLTRGEYVREFMAVVMRELSVEKPDVLDQAGAFNDAVNCAVGTLADRPPAGGGVRDVVGDTLEVAKRCASTAVERLGTTLRQNVGDVLAVVAAFPDTFDALAAVVDGVKISADVVDRFGGQFDLRFTRAAGTPQAAPAPPPGRTEVFAQIRAVDRAAPGSVTYDEIQWFWAPAAAQKCAEDGTTPNGAWCTDYYYRNVNGRLRTAPLDAAVAITLAPEGTGSRAADVAQLAALVNTGYTSSYSMVVVDGVVTEVHQIFTP